MKTIFMKAKLSVLPIAAARLALLCAMPLSLRAATYLVTSTADSGLGSLRAALADATNGDTINATGASGTITLTSGQLNVINSITILGPGPGALTVSGNQASGVFNVTGANVTISGLTIANGYSTNNGAGINSAATPGSLLTLNDCVVTNSSSLYGGGIFNSPGVTMTISNSTISGNYAGGNGGGIYNSNATLTLITSTLSGNSAYLVGGGVMNYSLSGNAALTIDASTFSSNSAWSGGGIVNYSDSGSATLTINASTLSGNLAYYGSGGGGIENVVGTLVIGDTILNAGASGGNIYNYSGTVTSDGYNLSSDDGDGYLTATGDQVNINPVLGPLQNNGGPTFTHALLPGSPAIDQGKANAVSDMGLATDQRGLPRAVDFATVPNAPGGDGSDIGAFEMQYSPVVSTADSGPGSLRAAVANSASGYTITFAPALSGQTILLTSGQIPLNQNLFLDASALSNGISINGNNAGRVFEVSNATVVLNSLTITNGEDNNDDNFGGGGVFIYSGNLTLNNCTVAGNSANNSCGGGGIYNNSGTVTVNNCTVAGNSANDSWGGGGILNSAGTVTLNQCTLSGNSVNNSEIGGGGIFNDGTVTINASTLSGNSADACGGGIYNFGLESGASLAINTSTLSGNSAGYEGGGIFNEGEFGGSTTFVSLLYTILNAGASGANIYNDAGTIISDGYNLSSDDGGRFLTATGDQINTDPKLGPLANNGGPTLTLLPLFGSPAIDAGDYYGPFATDQRGYPRLSGANVDIGAVEAQWAPANHPPLLSNSAWTWTAPGGARCFQFTFSNVTNADFTVLATTNLTLPLADWTMLAPVIQCSPGQYQFTDPGATNYPQRFYRVVSP